MGLAHYIRIRSLTRRFRENEMLNFLLSHWLIKCSYYICVRFITQGLQTSSALNPHGSLHFETVQQIRKMQMHLLQPCVFLTAYGSGINRYGGFDRSQACG